MGRRPHLSAALTCISKGLQFHLSFPILPPSHCEILIIPGFIYRTLLRQVEERSDRQGQKEQVKYKVLRPAHLFEYPAAGAGDATEHIQHHQAYIQAESKKQEE